MPVISDGINSDKESVVLFGELLNELFSSLDEMEVLYCVLRNYEGLPERIDNDIDILVHPKHIEAFHQCVSRAVDTNGWQVIKKPKRFKFRSYWLKAEGKDLSIHIDVWSSHHWKGISFLDDDLFVRGRKKFGQFYVPESSMEIGSMLIKDLIQNGAVKHKYTSRIQEFARQQQQELQEFLSCTFGSKLASWIVARASLSEWKELNGRVQFIRWTLMRRSFIRNPFLFIANFIGFLWGHFKSLVSCPNGMFIALVGPDGSGKSTVSGELQKSLTDLFGLHKYYHGRFEIFPDLKYFRNLFLRIVRKERVDPGETVRAEAVPEHSLWRTLVYVVYYSMEYFIGHLVVRRAQSIGNLIIFDRYYYDWFIQGYYGRTPRWILSVLKVILPRPDIVVYLRNNPEVIHKRKPELTVNQIADQNLKCQRIVSKMSYAITVDTEIPAEQVAREIKEKVVEIMAERVKGYK